MKKLSVHFVALLSLGAAQARATPVTLTFTGLQDLEPINNYYNGGSGGFGSTGGTNYGVSFSPDSIAFTTATGIIGNIPPPATNSVALFLVEGSAVTMDVAAGFSNGLSFDYSAMLPGSVDIYSGLNGTGSLLASLLLPANTLNPCGIAPYSCWDNISVAFAGTAQSAVFGGSANYIAFTNIGIDTGDVPPPSPVPEPSSLMLLGTGLAAAAGVVRRRIQA